MDVRYVPVADGSALSRELIDDALVVVLPFVWRADSALFMAVGNTAAANDGLCLMASHRTIVDIH
jgi:hypothetical protein